MLSHFNHVQFCATPQTVAHQAALSIPVFSMQEYKNTGIGCHVLLRGIFPTQGLDPGLLHCRWILYQLSHKGSPKPLQSCSILCDPMDCSLPGCSVHFSILHARILEWVAMSSSRGSSQPADQTHVSCVSCTGRRVLYY